MLASATGTVGRSARLQRPPHAPRGRRHRPGATYQWDASERRLGAWPSEGWHGGHDRLDRFRPSPSVEGFETMAGAGDEGPGSIGVHTQPTIVAERDECGRPISVAAV